MQYALDIRNFIYSHYFYSGLRVATGVIGLALLALAFSDLSVAMALAIGAMCTSLMDLPSPLRHKFNEMLASVLLCSAVTLLISLCAPLPWLRNLAVVLVSFLASLMVVYGKKTMPLQFAALFVMTLTLNDDLVVYRAFKHAGLFCAGGLCYLAYAMAVSWCLRRRIKQQVLAECLFEMARYLEIKAGFYDMQTALDAQFTRLVREQIAVAEKQQAARDLVLRDIRSPQDARLVQVHMGMLELYERVLSTHTDYELLRRHFAHSDILSFLRDLVDKIVRDMESVAFAVNRGLPSQISVNYKAELRAIQFEMQQLQQDSLAGGVPDEALTVLRSTFNKIQGAIGLMAQLHQATHTPLTAETVTAAAAAVSDVAPFLTRQKYELGLLWSNLRWHSPVFRFALRIAMAVAVGLLIGHGLPYGSHGYWIVLTIVVILKPSFSVTRQRRMDRLSGTFIGCVASALILRYVHEPVVLLACLFLATVAGAAFNTVRYRYAAIATCVQILLLIHLMAPDSHGVISERLLDTAIGVVVASLFSFVLPVWEYRSLPRLIDGVLQANRRYVAASCALLTQAVRDDFIYRLARKQFMDSLACLISAFVRMLDEPASRHRAVEDINRFIVQNYLVAAHVAALRLLLRRHADSLPSEAVLAIFGQVGRQVDTLLQGAQQRLKTNTAPDRSAVSAEQSHQAPEREPEVEQETGQDILLKISPERAERAWGGKPLMSESEPGVADVQNSLSLLLRRTRLLRADAECIAARSQAIGCALKR